MFNGSWRESLLSEIDLQIPDPAIDNLGNTSEQTDMYEGRMVHMAVYGVFEDTCTFNTILCELKLL